MQRETDWEIYRLPLDAALDTEMWQVSGHIVRVVAASTPRAYANVSINRPADPTRKLELHEGRGWQHGPFVSLVFDSPAQPGEWLDILIAGNTKDADLSRFELVQGERPKIPAASQLISGTAEIGGAWGNVYTAGEKPAVITFVNIRPQFSSGDFKIRITDSAGATIVQMTSQDSEVVLRDPFILEPGQSVEALGRSDGAITVIVFGYVP